ncbi:bifunctional lysylphosphatidylglycerol flippase/synthetase MprF [Weissella cibaria]|uniref:bifunctional lysylphosphatidylglycerol flippase/synthetase MprF n=1 Tax=Weissella cibaria TaxID=137591 RepID=UPI001897A7BD|nr:bifunctional lysylphosphatidylglycerol flippase/synthetase MprF [Weissella cibaria]MCT0000126.1 bifunctional lysylphosphatidylglycerol flippase/synthetase MprF [Weissella cibaria]
MNQKWHNIRRVMIIAVAFVALFELGAVIKRMPLKILLAIFAEIPIGLLIGIFVIGILTASVGVSYNWAYKRLLTPTDSKHYWLSSWVVNAFDNAFGVADFVVTWLQDRLFDDNRTERSATLHRGWWLSTSGLAVVSLLSLIATGIYWSHTAVVNYAPWLVVAVALPFIGLIVSRFRHRDSLPFSASDYARIFAASLATWVANTAGFLLIGALFQMPIAIWSVMPLFIAARTFGIVTLVPGGWGTFDIFAFIGLQTLGMDPAVIFLWILFYRVAYTIVPFIIAVIIAATRALRETNHKFRGVPSVIVRSMLQKAVTVLLYFSGITLIIAGALPGTLQSFHLLQHLSPWTSGFLLQVPNIFIGFMLIIAGRGIANKVSRAYWPTLILLAISFGYVAVSHEHMQPLVLLGALFIGTLFIKPTLTRVQFIYSWENRLIDGVIYGGLFIAYLTIGVANLPAVSHRFHVRTSGFFLVPSLHWWLIGFIAIAIVSLGVLGFIAYMQGRTQLLGEALDEERVNQVLARGDNHYTNLIFLGDKRLFYYRPDQSETDTVAIQFRLVNNKAAVMSDPFGDSADFQAALAAFISEADRLGYTPIFYEVSEKIAMMVHEFGYNFMKLGEEAWVDTPSFKTAGKKFANIRSEINQATAAGFTYEVLQPPFSDALLQELRQISDEWLHGREEKGYSLGFFDNHYLQRGGIGVLKAPDGHIVAFATLVTSETENQMTVDLMRFTSESPNGTMDVLFVKTFEYARDAGYNTFNLGMSPLSNVGLHEQSFIRERVANLIYQFGSKIYSFEGLRHYKHKFASDWQPYYIGYSNHSNIAFVMIALLLIDNPGVDLD